MIDYTCMRVDYKIG